MRVLSQQPHDPQQIRACVGLGNLLKVVVNQFQDPEEQARGRDGVLPNEPAVREVLPVK